MADWRHPYEDLLRTPLSAKDRLRGERMCAAASSGYHPTSVLRPWRRRSERRFEPSKIPSMRKCLTDRSEMMQGPSAKAQSCSASIVEKIMAESVYNVIELIGTSPESWAKAGKVAVERAAKTLRDLRVAEVIEQDIQLKDGKLEVYRVKLKVSFRNED